VIEQLEIVNQADPDEVREFPKGRFELYRIGGVAIGRASYEPGWRWTEHVAPTAGTELCEVEHLGMVVSGHAAVRMADGTERTLEPGDMFAIPPGHDSWVIGEAPYVSLHFLGADEYAR
jgi:quercetin dioxygenase-like cupin family protein